MKVKIEDTLATWFKSNDFNLCVTAVNMKENFDKYFGNIDKGNMSS